MPAFVLKTTWLRNGCRIGTSFFFLVVTYRVADNVLFDTSKLIDFILYFLSVLKSISSLGSRNFAPFYFCYEDIDMLDLDLGFSFFYDKKLKWLSLLKGNDFY